MWYKKPIPMVYAKKNNITLHFQTPGLQSVIDRYYSPWEADTTHLQCQQNKLWHYWYVAFIFSGNQSNSINFSLWNNEP